MVSGCGFLGKPTLREKLLRVAYWNLEDPIDEIMRKIQAACMRHELRPDDINGRLFVKSARDQHCIIARMLPSGGGHIVEPMVDAIIEDLRVNQIDVLYIDPFKKCHRVSENDNTMIDMVVDQWTRVAEEANVAVKLAHHTRKNGSAEIDTESSRGAKAATDAARSVVVVNRMTKKEAADAGISDNPNTYFRTYSDKLNLAPDPEHSDWFRLVNVDLANGDRVGVATRWPSALDDVETGDLKKVQEKIAAGEWRADVQAKQWAGYAVAEALDLDASDAAVKTKIKGLLKYWLGKGGLKIETRRDEKRRDPRDFVVVRNTE